MNGVIVYKGRYGATAQYAKWLGDSLRLPVFESNKLNDDRLSQFDYVIAGTSVYIGKLLLGKWINSHEKILRGKKMLMFVVCGTPLSEATALHNLVKKNIKPALLTETKVFFLRGRMIKSKLSFLDRFGLRMGASLQKDKRERERMLADFDDVRQENLDDILYAIKADSPVEIG